MPKSSRRYGKATKAEESTAATLPISTGWSAGAVSSRRSAVPPNSTRAASAQPNAKTGPAVPSHAAFTATGTGTPVVSAAIAAMLWKTAG